MVAVIWIDWYSYHVARFRALAEHPAFAGRAVGIELVGKTGVHQGLAFRDTRRGDLRIETLAADRSWHEAGQLHLALALWRKLDVLRPELVLVPGYYTLPALAAALWAKLRGKRSVLMTESGARDQPRSGWKEFLKSALIRSLFDFASAGGTEHEDYLAALGVERQRIRRFYDTVDNAFFTREAAQHRRSTTPQAKNLPAKYFLFVGRFAPEKNLGALIRAFAQYRLAGGTWSLVLAGDGPLLRELEDSVRQLNLNDAVHFAGMQPTAALPLFYAFASCFVLPSIREPWGLVVNEAMASGLPVLVSTHCGCATDLVQDARNGFLIDPLNEHAIAGRMMAIEALPDQDRDAMGARSLEIVSNYSPQHWAGEIASLLPEAARKSRPNVEAAA